MKVILFGATGMVGQGVLRECLRDAGVERVLTVGRSPTGQRDPKLEERVVSNLLDLSPIQQDLIGFDACFFCLGVSSSGMSEQDYRRITYDTTLAVAELLARLSPGMTFLYVSGQGTDSSERGRVMWARVKGATENALLRLPFRSVYMFRPGVIQPLHGIESKTRWYRVLYKLLGPVLPALKAMLPDYIITTEQLGRAMLRVAQQGYEKQILENRDIARM